MAGENSGRLNCGKKLFVKWNITYLGESNVQGNHQSNQHVGHQPSDHFVIMMWRWKQKLITFPVGHRKSAILMMHFDAIGSRITPNTFYVVVLMHNSGSVSLTLHPMCWDNSFQSLKILINSHHCHPWCSCFHRVEMDSMNRRSRSDHLGTRCSMVGRLTT